MQGSRRGVDSPALSRPRRPAESVLYRGVQEHLETYLARARAGYRDADPVPGFGERDFRRYLACGILAQGFARARGSEGGHEVLIAFSCTGRGVCPCGNARRRVRERRAPGGPRLSPPAGAPIGSIGPKRLRDFLQRDSAVAGSVLPIFLRVVEETLRQSSPGAGSRARFAAVSFRHRFGSALNPHLPFRGGVIDGLFPPDAEGRRGFHEALGLTPEHLAQVEEQVRRRVLRAFVHRGLLEPEAAHHRRAWAGGGGFSGEGSMRGEAPDRAGRERRLR